MSRISFSPRWREELVASSAEGTLVFELTMGTYHVYFPDEEGWAKQVPQWAKDKWKQYFDECSNWCVINNIPISIVDQALVYEEKTG